MKKLFIKTYGCQMNVYDSRRMEDVLRPHGYVSTDDMADADLVILNTCHIREKAAEKVYSDIGRIRQFKDARMKAGMETFLAIAGCVAQAEGAEIMRRAPAVDMVLGPQTYHRLPELIEEARAQRARGRVARVMDTDFPTEAKFDHLPDDQGEVGPSAFLTIQEGCDKFCTYCVVPYTRGSEFSRPIKDVVDEARRLVDAGAVEITLLGQNVNAYHGEAANGETMGLGGLIRLLDAIEGLERIRYVTSHPNDMQDDLIEAHRDVASCMPYLHLPVQAGSDTVLEAMNRHHTKESYIAVIDKMREVCPNIALSGDFIVGFPGESDQDFEDTLDLVRRVKYAQAYSFKYSPRPGTPASLVEDQVPEEVKSERLQRLQKLLNVHQVEFNEATVGQVLPVLLERTGKRDHQLIGRTPYMQSIHVDVKDHVPVDGDTEQAYSLLMNTVQHVEVVTAGPNSLEGRLVIKGEEQSAA